MARLLARLGVAVASLFVFASSATAQPPLTAPTYKSPSGVLQFAQGILCLNLDGTTCAFGGGGGSASPFAPDSAGSSTLAATTSTARAILPGGGATVWVQNPGAATAYVRLGTIAVNATVTDTPILPGQGITLAAGANTYLAGITASGSTTLTVTTGTGIPNSALSSDLGKPTGILGSVAPGSAGTGDAPVKEGGLAKSADPAARADGQIVEQLHDLLGKRVVIPALRAQKDMQTTTITSSAAETTIYTAPGASIFADLYGLVLDNKSATAGHCDIRDATAGTIRFAFDVAAGATGGFTMDAGSAAPQKAGANNNWTATCTSLASWVVTVLVVKTGA